MNGMNYMPSQCAVYACVYGLRRFGCALPVLTDNKDKSKPYCVVCSFFVFFFISLEYLTLQLPTFIHSKVLYMVL